MQEDKRLHDVYDDNGYPVGLHEYKWGEKVSCYLKYRDSWYDGIFITSRPEDHDTLVCTVYMSDMPIDYLPEEYVRPLK